MNLSLIKKTSILTLITILFSVVSFAQTNWEYKDYKWDETPSFKIPKISGTPSEVILKSKRSTEFGFEGNQFLQCYLSHRVTYINSEIGVERNNKIYLTTGANTEVLIQRARVIQPDGKIIEMQEKDIKEGKNEESGFTYKYFALEGLDIGSIVEEIVYLKKPASYFGNRSTIQSKITKYNVDFEIISPDFLIFNFLAKNNAPEPTLLEDLEEKNLYKVHLDTVPKIEDEPWAFTSSNVMYYVFKLSENKSNATKDITSYGSASKRYFDRIYNETSKADVKAIKKFLKEIGIKKEMSEEEKVRLLEHEIKTNYALLPYVAPEYENIPALLKKKASTSLIFTRLYANAFQEMGIKHQVVISSDRTLTPFDKKFEAFNFLEQTFFYMTELGKYLDPEMPSLRLGFIPWEYTENYGLFIKPLKIGDITTGIGKIKFIPALDHKASQHNHNILVDMTEDPLDPFIHFESEMSGYYAQFIQPVYSRLSDDEKEKTNQSLKESLTYESGEQELEVLNADAKYFGVEPMILKTSTQTLNFSEKAGNKVIFKVGKLIGEQAELYNEKPRVLAVENSYNRSFYREINIKIPENYKVSNLESLDFNIKIEDESAFFVSSHTLEGNMLTIKIDEIYNRIHYKLEEYEVYKNVVNAAADFNKAVIYLTKE